MKEVEEVVFGLQEYCLSIFAGRFYILVDLQHFFDVLHDFEKLSVVCRINFFFLYLQQKDGIVSGVEYLFHGVPLLLDQLLQERHAHHALGCAEEFVHHQSPQILGGFHIIELN